MHDESVTTRVQGSPEAWRQPERVRIFSPEGRRTGGSEALQQLANAIGELGIDVALVPFGTSAGEDTSAYDHYGCRWVDSAADEPGTVVIVPEVAVSLLASYRNAQRLVWWLSVDSSEPYVEHMTWLRGDMSTKRFLYRRVFGRRRGSESSQELRRLMRSSFHCSQSHYATVHLYQREGIRASNLSDYTTMPANVARPSGRTPRSVAFNPAKGNHFTTALQEILTDVSWRPISGMQPQRVAELLNETEIYLDLGQHPGKDRLPREAALAGCVVVTGNRGSAGFPQDVPITEALKVSMTADPRVTARRAAPVLERVMNDPETYRNGQARYRDWIRQEERRFQGEVADIFVRGQVAPTLGSRRTASGYWQRLRHRPEE